nr:HNH endonuclease [Actinomycetota bacterium]
RDHGCSFPGCGTRSFLQAHHIVHWEHGGTTDLNNLTLVCCFHHKLVHEYGWRVALDDDSMATWFRRSGRRYDPGPDPPLRLDLGPAPGTESPSRHDINAPPPLAAGTYVPDRHMHVGPPPDASGLDESVRDRELLGAAF